MRRRLALVPAVLLFCWAFVDYVSSWSGIAAQTLEATRKLCMSGGDLLLVGIAVPDMQLILALSLPPALLTSTAFIAYQLRTRRLLVGLAKNQVQPLPADVRDLAAETGVAGRVHVVESELPFAFCAGPIQPRVFVSSALLNSLAADELEAVLRHEAWHLRRRDPFLVALGQAVGRALFFLPRADEVLQRVTARREIEADDAAITQMGTPYPLAAALHKALQWPASSQPGAGAFSALDARIDHLLDGDSARRETHRRSALAKAALSAAALALLLCGAAAASSVSAGVPDTICRAC